MIRFVMPEEGLTGSEQVLQLHGQFDAFLNSEALGELFDLLGVDRHTIARRYDSRQMPGGGVRETQAIAPLEALEGCRDALYPLLRELGYLDINRPLHSEYSHVLLLGGSLNACFVRAEYAREWIGPAVRAVDGLACYRPINPIERGRSAFSSPCDTEFGVMADAFVSAFHLPASGWEDVFHGDRNLNRISCVRTCTVSSGSRQYRVFAAPSTQPELRRADTGDSLLYYLEQTQLQPSDSLLAITHNIHCNRQFIQLAYELLKHRSGVYLDVIGCVPDDKIVTRESYNPALYIQELISTLDWIERFESRFC